MQRLNRIQRWFIVTVVGIVVTLPLVLYGKQKCVDGILTLTSRWLPASAPEQVSLRKFIEQFESGDFVLATWPDCTVDDPRLLQFEKRFEAMAADESYGDLFDYIVTGRSLSEQMTAEPLALSRDEVRQRLSGTLIGADGETTCAVVALTEKGAYERREALDVIQHELGESCDVPLADLRLVGPPVEGVFVDEQSVFASNILVIPSFIVSGLLCWWCLRSWWYSLIVILTGAFGQGMIMALMYFMGVRLSAVLIILPPLVFVLTISSGVHLINYFYNESSRRTIHDAVVAALAIGWKPCAIAILTTAVGLGSLALSDIGPIHGIWHLRAHRRCPQLLDPDGAVAWRHGPVARRITRSAAARPAATAIRRGAVSSQVFRGWAAVMAPLCHGLRVGRKGARQRRPKTASRIAPNASASAASKAAGRSLSMSKTPRSAPDASRTGSTSSERVELAQAIWPAKASTSATICGSPVRAAAPQTPRENGITRQPCPP